MEKTIRSLLVANRGEIARRILRTARRMGIRTVAVHSDVDRGALHVKEADTSVALGGNRPQETYLDIEKILGAARRADVEAIHPGYGFLSERPPFARRCREEGIIFVGPSPEAMEALGDKERARILARSLDIPVPPGSPVLRSADEAREWGERIGFPVLFKAPAGGGGIGMKRVDAPGEVARSFDEAARRAQQAFGDGRIYLEKYLDRPHHIEIQVLGDSGGRIVTFVERECSVQRRHQKVIEESPSPFASPALREKLRGDAGMLMRKVSYTNAGTVEFVVDGTGGPCFLEVNTRLQVEHPVTEMVTGLDLVELQLRIAAGEPLGLGEGDVPVRGWAIEARVYAEDPERFLPSPGTLALYREPRGEGIRVDGGYAPGDTLTPFYDPLIAKLVAHGPDRPGAIGRMAGALGQYEIGGLKCNLPFLRRALGSPLFRSGNYTTHFIQHLREAPHG